MSDIAKAWSILESADLVCSAERVEQAMVAVAAALTEHYRDRFPVVLCVMNGAIFFCGKLMGLLRFPLTLDYVMRPAMATQRAVATCNGVLNHPMWYETAT